MQTDNQLLECYHRDGSEQAFRELVERRINLVFSAALREACGNASEAQDLTQAVFVQLARSAGRLLRHPGLSGWLYTCVRHTAANSRRAQGRRRQRENETLTMNQILGSEPVDELWRELRPQLDDLMHELDDEDRTAVVLRFFENRSLKEVGSTLGLTENAARMRVERALEKLRVFLGRRGINSTAGSLAAVLAWAAVLSVPPTLAATVATEAIAAASGGFPGLHFLARFKLKTALPFVVAGLVTTWIIWDRANPNFPTARFDPNQEIAKRAGPHESVASS